MKYYSILLFVVLCGAFLFGSATNAQAALRAECTVFPSDNVVPGEEVTWRAEGQGGGETYEYIWSGSEGLVGRERNASIRYQTEGLKQAQVTVISGREQRTVACSQVDVRFPPLRGACYVSTEASKSGVHSTYTTDIRGGNGVYAYSWSGTENLSGDGSSLTHSYSAPGFKVATVRVSSAGQTLILTCNVDVPEINRLPDTPIIFGCEGESDRFVTREEFEWRSIFSVPRSQRNRYDRMEDVSYTWEGTDDKDAETEDMETRYNTSGYKTMNHRVSDSFISFRANSNCQTYIAHTDDVSSRDTSNLERQWRQGTTGNPSDERYLSSGIRITYNAPDFDACFIASAAYGTKWEPQVETLREFRDTYLETNTLGRLFVDVYYTLGPGYAYIIQKSDLLRMHARTLLTPLVASAKILL